MQGPIPKCLVCLRGDEWLTVPHSDGKKILFAFTSLQKGEQFCSNIPKQAETCGWYPYNMTGTQDLRTFLEPGDAAKRRFVAIDASGLRDGLYHVVNLGSLVEAMEQGSTEIEYTEYVPPEPRKDDA